VSVSRWCVPSWGNANFQVTDSGVPAVATRSREQWETTHQVTPILSMLSEGTNSLVAMGGNTTSSNLFSTMTSANDISSVGTNEEFPTIGQNLEHPTHV